MELPAHHCDIGDDIFLPLCHTVPFYPNLMCPLWQSDSHIIFHLNSAPLLSAGTTQMGPSGGSRCMTGAEGLKASSGGFQGEADKEGRKRGAARQLRLQNHVVSPTAQTGW